MEPVNDIIEEMREIRPDCDDCLSNHTCDYLSRFADRIDAANKRDMQSMIEAGERDMRTAMDEVTMLRTSLAESAKTLDEYREENVRLKAALKPVLECDINGTISRVHDDSLHAVMDAKRIYNRGAK